jgi:hypothetical protein
VKIQAILGASLIALASSSALAEPLRPIFGPSVLPPPEINSIVRSMGLLPTGAPVREGLAYVVLATDPRGNQVRVIVDARFGDVLSVRRVIAAGPPGAYPEPRRLYGAVRPRPYAPYERPWMGPDFRPPGTIGRVDPRSYPPAPQSKPATSTGDKPEQKSAAAPTKPTSVVTVGPSAAVRAADPKPTGSTPKASGFPPVQSLE